MQRPHGFFRWLPWLACAVVTGLVLNRAWLSDDAFITLRTIDHAVQGFGLRWNVAERVQAFTHPLWAMVLIGPYAVTREPYFTTLACSVVVTVCSLYLIGVRLSGDALAGALALALLAMSGAFLDYSTSGLENPLAHLLLALYGWMYFRSAAGGLLTWLAILAGLLVLVRTDLALLVAPSLVWRAVQAPWRAVVRAAIVGAAPVLAWTAAALVYYGFPVPNTAYAKLNTGIGAGELVEQGSLYLIDGLSRDPQTLLTCLAAIVAGAVAWRRPSGSWALGIALYLGYVVRIGGDYMSGRFLTAPFVASVVLFSASSAPVVSRRLVLACLAGLAAGGVVLSQVWPVPDRLAGLKSRFATDSKWSREPPLMFRFITDQRAENASSTGLRAVLSAPGREIPHDWARMGRDLRATGRGRVLDWGAIGMVGYFGGPAIHIVDPPALGDPLLARLPAKLPWYPGHFDRRLPPGYFESLQQERNRIAHPGARQYYEHLRVIVRGPVWSRERFVRILNMNLGRYESLLSDYGVLDVALNEWPGYWTAFENAPAEVWEGGLVLRCRATCAATRLTMRIDVGNRYRVRYVREGTTLAEQFVGPLVGETASEVVSAVPDPARVGFGSLTIELVGGRHPGRISDVVLLR